MYYDDDADLTLLDGKTVAIIGYGSQGHAHAMNLKDSGVNVVVGLRSDSPSVAKAEAAGLTVLPVADAASAGDIVMMLVPDEKHREIWEADVRDGIAEGNLLLFGVEAIGDADERGMRNVLGTINGQMRPIEVRDRSVDSKVASSEKADIGNPQHVSVPFAGVVNPLVAEGDTVEAGQTVATIEAMKMEAAITSANAGTVERLVITDTRQAEGGDLLLVLG